METEGPKGHVSERFGRLLALHREPDGSKWGGQDLEAATGGAVTRSHVSNLKNGRIGNPGVAKLEAIAGAMGFPPELWFGGGSENRGKEGKLLAVPGGGVVQALVEEALELGPKERDPLLRIARRHVTRIARLSLATSEQARAIRAIEGPS